MKWQLILSGMILASPLGANETGPISAERPGFSSSPFVLAATTWQLETGYQFTRESGRADFDDHTLPLLLIRTGIGKQLELQFSWSGYSWQEVAGRSFSGTNDAGIGLKWQVTEEDAAVPVAFFAGLSLPVGNDDFSSDEVEPTFGAFWSYSAGLDWFGTLLISESDHDTSLGNAVGINFSIADNRGAYIEYFGNYGSAGGPEHYLNGGLTYLPANHLQLDVNTGLGLNGRAADLFVGLGLAYRF